MAVRKYDDQKAARNPKGKHQRHDKGERPPKPNVFATGTIDRVVVAEICVPVVESRVLRDISTVNYSRKLRTSKILTHANVWNTTNELPGNTTYRNTSAVEMHMLRRRACSSSSAVMVLLTLVW